MVSERLSVLDGLRGAAILLVMFHHFGVHPTGWWDWGPIAPSVFFLLSGYLITLSLARIHTRWAATGGPQGWDMFHFHLRRLVRLMPAFYVLLLAGVLLGWREFREEFFWHASFMTNWQMAIFDHWPDRLSHLWSLSLQEEFYLLWPLILFLPARFLPWAFGIAFLSAAAFRAWCLHAGVSDMFRWFMLPGSLDNFAAGGLVAWAISKNKIAFLLTPRGKWIFGLLAIGGWLVSRQLRDLYGTGNLALALVESLESLFFAWLLLMLLQARSSGIHRFFSLPPLVYLGRISYGLYLWHVMVFCLLAPVLANFGLRAAERPFVVGLIITVACVAVATLSWKWLEEPFIHWSKHLKRPEIRWSDFRAWFANAFRRTSVE